MRTCDNAEYHRRRNICGCCVQMYYDDGIIRCSLYVAHTHDDTSLEELTKQPGWKCPLGKWKESKE